VAGSKAGRAQRAGKAPAATSAGRATARAARQPGASRFDALASLQRPSAGEVLELIWRERRISRAEIARRTGLSRSTVSEIVEGLLQTRLVAEVGDGPSEGGRRPVVLQFQDDAYGILGIDVGAAHVAAAIIDLRGQVLAWEHRAHAVRADPVGTTAIMLELSEACLRRWKLGTERLAGVGIAVPSPVDPRDPDHVSDVVMPEWKGHSVGGPLRERYGVPVFVDNDANLGALAERWWGAGREVDDFVYVKVATGVGAGLIVRKEIYRGARGVAGEIGHLAIDPKGEPCVCGLRGCLATRVGSRALVARAAALLPEYPASSLAGREPTLTAIEDAALAGDPLALRVVDEAAEYLGIAVAGMLNLINPGRVIIGGGLSRLGELLLSRLRRPISSRTLVGSIAQTEIVTSELGSRTVALGAATLVLQNALADLRHFRIAAARS
jgi:glucokinase-like ROK family protein